MNRRWQVALAAVGVLALSGTAVWNIPLYGQKRPDIAVTQLLLDEPPMRDVTWNRVDTQTPTAPFMRGLEERRARLWFNDDDRVGGSIASYRFESPTWAWLNYRDGSPNDQYAEFFIEIRRVELDVDTSADEARFYCGTFHDPDVCSDWWGWLRYGQYIVDIELEPDPEKPWPKATDLEQAVKSADEHFLQKL